MSLVWLVLAIATEVCATLSMRASDGFRKKGWIVPIVLGYVLAFTFMLCALGAGMPVGIAYGLWAAIGIALVALLARAIWKDPLTKRMLLGIVVIGVGVLLVEIG